MTTTSLSDREFRIVAQYIESVSGIVLDQSKIYLLEGRLRPLLEQEECKTYVTLVTKAKADHSRRLENFIIDAMTVNETSFFRDLHPFELFKQKVLPDCLDRIRNSSQPQRQVKVWSAACSTGQEAYSLAISSKELLADAANRHVQIVGTDISEEAIIRANRGRYTSFETSRGLSDQQKQCYFAFNNDMYQVQDHLRGMVSFKQNHLLEPSPQFGSFDVIFCRYVAIYFAQKDRQDLFERLVHQLYPGGILVLGATEKLPDDLPSCTLQNHHNTYYYEAHA